ncbi:hypothetical protein EVG20_g639 [Dentipellis fragilis]|uniref:Cytoplasmic protein n=1 Tax=Dentipellis fragilis TaxID=205917 RepID=A0A4Y9ZCT6_9AGAM|nr:hypothetical protein EVG20_g639 [Dentipellis fragilis]
MSSDFDDTPTNLAAPKTAATLTIRIIKSFEYRTERSLVLHDLNFENTTVGDLKEIVRQGISVFHVLQAIHSQPAWKAYRTVSFDTFKLYTKAHGAKTTNLIINLDHDDWILDDENRTLSDYGFENETEISFFNRESYERFKKNPVTRWD